MPACLEVELYAANFARKPRFELICDSDLFPSFLRHAMHEKRDFFFFGLHSLKARFGRAMNVDVFYTRPYGLIRRIYTESTNPTYDTYRIESEVPKSQSEKASARTSEPSSSDPEKGFIFWGVRVR